MRKLAVIGTVAAAGMVLVAGGAQAANGHADQVTSQVGGAMAPVTNTCFAIIDAFFIGDCSFAATRYPGKVSGGTLDGPVTTADSWLGPVFATGFYARGSAADPGAYPDPRSALGYVPSPGDNKYAVPLVGSVIVDDKGTDSPADDSIAATWVFGAAVYNTQVGQGDYAAETWDTFTHVMAATAVNPTVTVANADGGFDYVIGSRGKPTPATGAFPHAALPGDGVKNLDPFPSEFALVDILAPELRWSPAGATDLPIAQRVGIERSVGFGNTGTCNPADPRPSCPTGLAPNVGGQTTGSFTGYTCTDDAGDNDCTTSEILFGSQSPGGGATSPPGFENVILLLSTRADGTVTSARAYWTREYVLKQGAAIGNDHPVNRNLWTTPNSWTGGRFDFRGCSASGPVAEPDFPRIVEGASSAAIQVLTNDTAGCDDPNVIQIVSGSGPTHGVATVSGDGRSILYTPSTAAPAYSDDIYYDGPDSLTYKIIDDVGNESAPAAVDITVTKKVPIAGSQSGTSSSGSIVTVTALTAGSLGSGTIDQHTLAAGAGTLGSCAVSGPSGTTGNQLIFTPTAGAGNGTGGCSYTITDVDGDTATGQLTVDVRNNGASGGGSGGPQLPSGGSSLDALTLGALLAGLPLLGRRRRRD